MELGALSNLHVNPLGAHAVAPQTIQNIAMLCCANT